ncbi:MAG TPA: hypothetical protein VNH11_35075 [Pirellulales bacterium]|nr:hypothetical protein [Pirellulales bacterium]
MRLLHIAGFFAAVTASTALAEPAANPPSASQTTPTSDGDKQAAPAGPSREMQRAVLQKMKSRKPNIRVAAVRELAAFPAAETARFLVQHGLTSAYDDVRETTYKTLLELNGPGPVADYLLDTVAKEVKRSEPRETLCGALAAVMASSDADVERRALELFDQTIERAHAGAAIALTLIDQLGLLNDETSVATLVKIAKRRAYNNLFAVRRAVVQSLTRITVLKSTEALVNLLATATGEVRVDIVRHLTSVSGRKFGVDPRAWMTWWQAQQRGTPKDAGQTYSMAQAMPSKSTYYGLPIYAARLLFVIDTSASMAGGRIEAAKRELSSAILSLPEGTHFNVLSFDIVVLPWSAQLMPSTPENKAAAIAWVLSRGLGPQTASYNALEAAFAFDTESIYFLTDGQPAGGKIDNPAQIVAVLTALNQTRRLTINSIGIGVGPPGPLNPFDQFLSGLALLNYGEYRRVDQ